MDNLKFLKLPYKSVFKVPSLKQGAVSYLWPIQNNFTRNKVLFFIPGNPGCPEYYIDFLDKIYNELGKKIEIILIGHVGQSSSQSLGLKSENIYSLQDQVDFKIACMDSIVESYPEDTDFFIMSHSMGSWLTEQVIKARPQYNIKHIYNLFPALCDIRNTPNGYVMCRSLFLKYPMMLVIFIAYLFNLLPRWIKFEAVKLFTRQSDRYATVTTDNLLLYKNPQNCIKMGYDEMQTINELDKGFYIANQNRLTIYYGENDGWAPKEHYLNMKQLIPNADIHFCNEKVPHAFVLDHSDLMALKVSKWMQMHF